MKIEILEKEQTAVWQPQNELEDPSLLKTPMERFIASGLRVLLLDLANKEWLSSSEIGVIMWIFKELDRIGATLCLLAVSPFVMKTIKVTGIDQLLSVYESQENALAVLGTQG